MRNQPCYRVFLSAVSGELGSYRKEIARVLRRKGIDVRDQEHFRQGGSTLLESLNEYIKVCDAIICLIGDQCGSLPTDEHMAVIGSTDWISQFRQASGQHQISYTQWEFLLAKNHSKSLYVYLTADGFAPAGDVNQSEFHQGLQAFYRDWVEQTGIHWYPLTTLAKLIEDVLVLPLNEESLELYQLRLTSNKDTIEKRITDKYEYFREHEKFQIHEKSIEIYSLRLQLDTANQKLEEIEKSFTERNMMLAKLRESNPDAKLQKAINLLAAEPEVGTEELQKISVSHSAQAVNAKLILAKYYYDSLLYEGAMECCEESIQIDSKAVAAYEFGAYVANHLGMMDRSRELLLKQKELIGDDPASLSSIANNLGVLEKNQNRHDTALEYFQEALRINTTSDEHDKLKIQNIEISIAGTYGELGRYQMSIDLYEDLLARLEPNSTQSGVSMLGISSCHYALNNASEGENWAEKAYLIFKANGFKEQSFVLELLRVMVNNYCTSGKHSKASDLVAKFERDMRVSFEGDDSIHICEFLSMLAKYYEIAYSKENAERLYIDLIAKLEKYEKQHHVFLANANAALGKFYRFHNELQKAKTYFLRTLKIRTERQESTSMMLAITQNNLAGVYCALERFVDAEPLYLESLAIREFNFGSKNDSVVRVCCNIAKMYLAMGKLEEAYEYSRKACNIATYIFSYRDIELKQVHDQLNEIKSEIRRSGLRSV